MVDLCPPELTCLTTGGVADTLGTTRRGVRRLIHSGALPAIRIPGQWRVCRGDLAAYQAANPNTKPPPMPGA